MEFKHVIKSGVKLLTLSQLMLRFLTYAKQDLRQLEYKILNHIYYFWKVEINSHLQV